MIAHNRCVKFYIGVNFIILVLCREKSQSIFLPNDSFV